MTVIDLLHESLRISISQPVITQRLRPHIRLIINITTLRKRRQPTNRRRCLRGTLIRIGKIPARELFEIDLPITVLIQLTNRFLDILLAGVNVHLHKDCVHLITIEAAAAVSIGMIPEHSDLLLLRHPAVVVVDIVICVYSQHSLLIILLACAGVVLTFLSHWADRLLRIVLITH